MSQLAKSDFIQRFDRQYFARPRRAVLVALAALLALQALTVAVIVSSESTKLDSGRRLVEECPPGSTPNLQTLSKRGAACRPLAIRFDTKV